jgi:hypothetical protein
MPSKLALDNLTVFELALSSCEPHTFSLEMAGERSVLEVLLAPSLDVPGTKVEDLPTATEVTACQAKTATLDILLKIAMISTSRKIAPSFDQQSPSMWTSASQRPKEDKLRYLSSLAILITLTRFD